MDLASKLINFTLGFHPKQGWVHRTSTRHARLIFVYIHFRYALTMRLGHRGVR